ncbi:MAG: RNA-guided pseudouridylation complex pseudouridine synthase subunit Cbf5 [Candidatus Pacearchaeota archaeon]
MEIDIEKIKSKKSTKELLEFGIINIDKPSGPTSFWVSQYVKRALKLSKTSHLGTLDPQVTGVLPVALSRACRLNEYLMHRDKTYIGIMQVHNEISKEKLEKEILSFVGKIMQMPPVKSRVKRELREREVKTFKIIEIDGKDVLFESQVQAGTYIRKLCSDLGEKIGGAHMLELRRTQAGLFAETDKKYPSVNMYEFDGIMEEYSNGNEEPLRKVIIPGEVVSELIPVIFIRKDVVKKALTGSPIFESFVEGKYPKLEEGDKLCAFTGDKFIGCYKFIGKGDLVAKPEFVLN